MAAGAARERVTGSDRVVVTRGEMVGEEFRYGAAIERGKVGGREGEVCAIEVRGEVGSYVRGSAALPFEVSEG